MTSTVEMDFYVGEIARLSMVGAILFFMAQILIPFPVIVMSDVAPVMEWFDQATGKTVAYITFALLELGAVLGVAFFIRRRLPKDPRILTQEQILSVLEDGKVIPFTERQLEIAILAMGALPLMYLLGEDPNVLPTKIFLLVVDSFAAVFMFIFIVVRWMTTKEVRVAGLAGVFLTVTSIVWLLDGTNG